MGMDIQEAYVQFIAIVQPLAQFLKKNITSFQDNRRVSVKHYSLGDGRATLGYIFKVQSSKALGLFKEEILTVDFRVESNKTYSGNYDPLKFTKLIVTVTWALGYGRGYQNYPGGKSAKYMADLNKILEKKLRPELQAITKEIASKLNVEKLPPIDYFGSLVKIY